MHIYTLPRGRGKTRKLIEWLLHDPDHRIVIVADERRREHVIRKAYRAYDGSPSGRVASDRDLFEWWTTHVLTLANYRSMTTGRDTHGWLVAIDDLEDVLQNLLMLQVDIVTTSELVLDYYEAPMVSDPSVAQSFN